MTHTNPALRPWRRALLRSAVGVLALAPSGCWVFDPDPDPADAIPMRWAVTALATDGDVAHELCYPPSKAPSPLAGVAVTSTSVEGKRVHITRPLEILVSFKGDTIPRAGARVAPAPCVGQVWVDVTRRQGRRVDRWWGPGYYHETIWEAGGKVRAQTHSNGVQPVRPDAG